MILTEYVTELNQRIDREKESLASGSSKSFDDYSRKVGLIAGMRAAVSLLYELVERLPREERDL